MKGAGLGDDGPQVQDGGGQGGTDRPVRGVPDVPSRVFPASVVVVPAAVDRVLSETCAVEVRKRRRIV